MAKRYIRLNWQNRPSVATPVSAANLNKMDKGIDDVDTALNKLENSIVGQIVNDPSKINNATVNYSLSQDISALNDNLAGLKFEGFFVSSTTGVVIREYPTQAFLVAARESRAGARGMYHFDQTSGISVFSENTDLTIACERRIITISGSTSTASHCMLLYY